MIRFACPTCGNGLTAPMNQGGAVTSCPHCKQLVQVPQMRVPETKVKAPPGTTAGRARRERRTFWALCRLSLWGLCFVIILVAIVNYAVQIGAADTFPEKTSVALQALVWIFASYYLARAFEDVSKSFEELRARMSKKA